MVIIGRRYESKHRKTKNARNKLTPDDFNQFPFLKQVYTLQEVSLEYNILHWNKTKQIICISKKYSCFTKILGITSVV